MSDDLRFERSTRDWLELGPTEAPTSVVQAALLEIDSTPQERDLRVPWRFLAMPTLTRPLVAAVVIVGLALSGLLLMQLDRRHSVAAPSLPGPVDLTPTGAPSPGASSRPLGLTNTFTSPTYGYSISVTPEWTADPATLTWSGPDNNSVDVISFPEGGGISAGSIALRPGQTWADWLNEFQPPSLVADGCAGGDPSTWPRLQIGTEVGLWQQMCGENGEAVVQVGDRAYVFGYGIGASPFAATLGQFKEQVLPTIRFDPAAVQPPSPPPALSTRFTSDRYGYSLSYPAGFSPEQARKSVKNMDPDPAGTEVDRVTDDSARLVVWSAKLGAGQSAQAWAQAFCAARRNQWTQPCDGAPGNWLEVPLASGTARLMVDGESVGRYVHDESRLFMATATKGDRVYVVQMDGLLNENLFLAILASMNLDPASAK
jgi:hypothetical protein